MVRLLAWLTLVAVITCACTTATSHDATTATTITSSASTTTTTSGQPVEFGRRQFTVTGVHLASDSWLTIGLHPTTAPIHLRALAAVPLEVCPAGLDGSIQGGSSSWPPWFHFPSCVRLTGSGTAILPRTDGQTHVAFALRPSAPTGSVRLSVVVDYSATDAFVEVVPPTGTVGTDLTVTYTPRSETTGAVANLVGQVRPAPGYTVAVTQASRALTRLSACDFGSEIDCVGGVAPSVPVAVRLTGPGSSKVVLYVAWK